MLYSLVVNRFLIVELSVIVYDEFGHSLIFPINPPVIVLSMNVAIESLSRIFPQAEKLIDQLLIT